MDILDAKRTMRARMRAVMQVMPRDEKRRLDAALRQSLMQHPWMREADTILCYCSTELEPDTRWLPGWAMERGRQAAFPVCTGQGEMRFCLLRTETDVRLGRYGIPEPIGRKEPAITEKTVCLVPGYAFSADGRRLGKGGGYYDRFLSRHPGLRTIGLTYEKLLQEDIPCESHDIIVDAVVTDRRNTAMHETA